MRILTFLSRVALLCNAFFVICLVLRVHPFTSGNKDLEGFLIIMGWILAPLVNTAVYIWMHLLVALKRPVPLPIVSKVLHWVFFVLQLIFIFLK